MLLALLLALQSAPPVPPPDRDRHEAAIRLWQEHPPSEFWRRQGIETALSHAAGAALVRAGMMPGQRRWVARLDGLHERLRSQVPANRTALDRQAIACAATGIAYSLSVEEIEEAHRFLATEVGRKFWDAAGIGHDALQRCYASVLVLRVSDDDYRAVGLRPPRPRSPRGHVVS